MLESSLASLPLYFLVLILSVFCISVFWFFFFLFLKKTVSGLLCLWIRLLSIQVDSKHWVLFLFFLQDILLV